MSRKATNEYIGTKRRTYAQSDRANRMRILDEVCETTGYERKYATPSQPVLYIFCECVTSAPWCSS